MQSIDDILNDMGLGEERAEESAAKNNPLLSPQEPEITTLSDDDFQEILNAIAPPATPPAFPPSPDDWNGDPDEYEEEEEQEEEVLVDDDDEEDAGEERDFDAEEDADWAATISSGIVSPVETPEEPVVHEQEVPAESVPDTQEFPESPSSDIIVGPDVSSVDPEPETIESPSLIEENSPTLTMRESTSRFSGTEWYNAIRNTHITFAGAGGIGSNAIFQLARMAPSSILIYDNDTVEAANMSGQLFSRDDIGRTKADAISTMINRYTDAQNIISIPDRFTSDSAPSEIMMCGFDNMEARRTFYTAWKALVLTKSVEERKKCLFIDGRLSINVLQVLCITGEDTYYMDRYENEFLFDDSEAEQTICSMKQTTYMACMIGSMITNLFTNWVANLLEPAIPYNLPFFTEYDAQHMIFKTEK